MVNFLDSIKEKAMIHNIVVEEVSSNLFLHTLDLDTTSDKVLFLNAASKGIFIYKKENDFIVLGSVINNKKRKLRQLVILTIDKSTNSLLDNTGNPINEDNVVQTLIDWLK